MPNFVVRLLSGRIARRILIVAVLAAAALVLLRGKADEAAPPPPVVARAALSVSLVAPQRADWPQTLTANGSVAAWQEALIAPEISGYRITQILVDVGDKVTKGQVLARIADDVVASELAEARASVAELAASAEEAQGNALRARELREKGFYSAQQALQYQTAEHTSGARLAAARARLQAAQVKMGKTAVRAPDDGLISARSAVVGSLTQNGEELFRLIRGARIEWRAEVPAADIGRLSPGVAATLSGPDNVQASGRVRAIAPSINANTRNGLVFVDLPADAPLKAGMFARGEFELGRTPALTLPQSAVVLRDGFAYVFRQEGADRVAQVKVTLGRRLGERIEILAGLPAQVRVVASGAGFLADGDFVKVVAATDGAQ